MSVLLIFGLVIGLPMTAVAVVSIYQDVRTALSRKDQA